MNFLRRAGCLLFSLMMAAGCASTSGDRYFTTTATRANVYVAPVEQAVAKIAIMPFKGSTELIGTSVSDMFVTEMLRAGRYTLVERSQMNNVLGESEVALSGLSQQQAVAIGNMLGADGVVIGTVDEYANVARGGKTYPVVGISTRMIDCKSGKVIWSADLAERAADADITLPQQARKVVHQITAALYKKWCRTRRVQAAAVMAPPMAAPALPPAPPANLESGDFGLREVTLSWSAAAGAERVRIERAARADGPFLPLETVSAARGRYTDRGGAAGLSDNTTYYYRLVALGATGLASPPSTVVESMTAPPPDPPATLRAAAPAARAARIEWNAPRAEGVEKYCIERCNAAAGNEWTDCGRVAQCCFAEGGSPKSPLADSTAYRYRVASVNRVGAVGAWSAPVTVTTRPPPEIVGGLAAKRGEVRCVPLTWQAAHENDIVAYEIERRGPLDEDFQPLATLRGAPSVSYLDGRRIPGSLGDDQTFFYRIRARNAVGACGAWCEPVEATTRPPPPPVTGLAAQGGLPRAVEVTWDPSPDEKVAGYVVERGEGDEKGYVEIARLAGIAATRLLDRAGASASAPCGRLRDGADYRYRVRACNVAKALSEWCAPMAARTKPAPAAPAAVTATATLGRRVELAWQANAEEDIANYVVESREAGSSRWREVARTDKTALTHGGLDDNERRDYRVKARDRDTLESAWSTVAAGGTRPLPPAPEDLAVTWRDGQAVLTWQAPVGVTATGYRVWKRTMLGLMSARLGETAVCEFAMAPATIGRKVAVEVTALDDEGLESARSAALEIVPPPSPVAEALQAKKTGDEH